MLACLVIGHTKGARGARNDTHKTTEYELNEQIARGVVDRYSGGVDLVPVYRGMYVDLPDVVNAYKPTFALSLHCNSYDKATTGTETLYYKGSHDGKRIAEICQNIFVRTYGLRDRGLKPCDSEDRGGFLLRGVKAPIVICEPFFIDNDNDYMKVISNGTTLIECYMSIIDSVSALF